MCCQLKTNRSSEQSGETGSGLFLTDSFLFGLVGSCGRGVCGSGGGCGGCGGSRRGRDSGACDGLLDAASASTPAAVRIALIASSVMSLPAE